MKTTSTVNEITIKPIGPLDAKIMFIDEVPNDAEIREGVAFAGMGGKVLDTILAEVGITRSDCYVTSVMLKKGGKGYSNFNTFYTKVKGKITASDDLLEGYRRLEEEIIRVSPNVIVPMGAEALKAVMGKGYNITDWRGSVLESKYGKVIPVIHPTTILREWSYRPATVLDFYKIKRESMFREVKTLKRDFRILYDYKEVLDEIKRLREQKEIAFDIEVESGQITCIGFASEEDKACCIPFWFGGSGSLWSEECESTIWRELRGLLESDKPKKIAHNGSYDIEYLHTNYGINTKLGFDTMLAFHVLYPELPKALAFLVSIYTDHPYYKYQRQTSSMDEYFKYNATDACLTYACSIALQRELKESNLRKFYVSYVHSLIEPLLSMQFNGVRFDTEKRNVLRRQYRMSIAKAQTDLEELVGYPLNISSNAQMTKWLYKECGVKQRFKKRGSGITTESADEETLHGIYKDQKTKEKVRNALEYVLKIRKKKKILSTYLDVKLDTDKRIRCSYLITGTETGRLSSRRTVRSTGTNLQNIPKGDIKRLFIPDEGKTFINADLSQAEARVVAYLAGEKRLIEVFETGGDIHRKNAANIFRKKEEEVSDKERQLAKRVVHASNYGMGERTFSSTAGIPIVEARRLLNQYFATYPRIRVWHMNIKQTLKKSRVLITPFGRKRMFFNRWSDSVFKEGLAYIPQSTVADLLNQGLIAVYDATKVYELLGQYSVDVLLQVHDSILIQCTDNKVSVEECVRIMKELMTIPVIVNGESMKIPVDFQVGKSWGDLKVYKGQG